MATNQINARHILAAKTLTDWTNTTTIPLKGETCYEILQTTGSNDFIVKMKVGNGIDVYTDLPYVGTQVLSGDNWIVTSTISGVTTLTHANPQSQDSTKTISESGTIIVTGVSVDSKGHVRAKPDSKTITSGNKINITNDADKITIAHTTQTAPTASGSNAIGWNGKAITAIGEDGYGHVNSVTTGTLPDNPVSAADGTQEQLMKSVGHDNTSPSGFVASSGSFDATSTTTLYAGKSIADYIGNTLSPLLFKGTIGTGGTVTSLPAAHTKGDVYIVKTAGTYAGQSCEVGDMIICVANGTTAANADWNVLTGENQVTNSAATITSSLTTIATVDGTNITAKLPAYSTIAPVQSVVGSSPITVTPANNTYTVSHDTSGVTAGSYGPTANVTGNNNNTIKVPQITVDAKGHVTGIVERTYTSIDHTYTIGTGALQIVANSATTGITTPYTANISSNTIGLNFINGTYTTAAVTAVSNKAPTITFSHNSTTRSDTAGTTALSFSAAVVTGVTTNATGHVTGITTAPLPANPVNNLLTGISLTSTGATSTSSNNAKLMATKASIDSGIQRTTTGLHTSLLIDDSNVTLIINGNF